MARLSQQCDRAPAQPATTAAGAQLPQARVVSTAETLAGVLPGRATPASADMPSPGGQISGMTVYKHGRGWTG